MSTAVTDGHTPELRQLNDPLGDHRAEQIQIGLAVAEESALLRDEHTGDKEHIGLTGVIEHEIGFVDRCEPLLLPRRHLTPPARAR